MSGPKVVRIVTEEERLAILEYEIARLESATNTLFKSLKRNGLLSDEVKHQFEEKLKYYKTNFSTKDYTSIPVAIAKEIEFIEFEKKKHENVAVEKIAQKRRYKRNLSESVRTFELLQSRGGLDIAKGFFPNPNYVLEYSDDQLKEIEEKMNTISEQLVNKQEQISRDANYSTEQKAVIERLNNTVKNDKPEKWETSPIEPQTLRIDSLLAELTILECDEKEKELFYQKLNRLYEEPAGRNKSMLIDSLVLDLSVFVKAIRALMHAKDQLREQQFILASLEIDLKEQIEKAIRSENIDVLDSMIEKCKQISNETLKERSAESGRKAIIRGLNALGYSVNQKMKTALVENGQLVVKHNNQIDYGVEVRTVPNTNKMQVRLVSHLPENERRAHDDIDAEEKWCSDFSRLKSLLSDQDVNLDYEMALKPGEQLVKYSNELKLILDKDSSSAVKKENRKKI